MTICMRSFPGVWSLKSGKGKGEVHLFSNYYSMTDIYFRFDIFSPKRFST